VAVKSPVLTVLPKFHGATSDFLNLTALPFDDT